MKPVLPLPSGGSREVAVLLTNNDSVPHSGEVALDLPPGFTADQATKPYDDLAPGAGRRVPFTVTSADATLPTSNAGGVEGDYDCTITTSVDGGGASETTAALELVPTTTIAEAPTAPAVDGTVGGGEYAGASLDLSRLWEGLDCASAADCSATGHLSRVGDRLYVGVEVTDDVLGTPLARSDCSGTRARTRSRSPSTRAGTPRTPSARSRWRCCRAPPRPAVGPAARATCPTPTTRVRGRGRLPASTSRRR